MGIAPTFLPFLDRLHARRPLAAPALGLGSLDLSGDVSAFGHPELVARGGRRAVGELLRLRYGVETYQDADINGLADLALDLSKPLPEALRGRHGTVLNAGTLEHVVDLRQAFQNVHELVRPGGTIVHIAPLTWMEHGFVNLSVRLFREIAAANGYVVELEAIWRRGDPVEAEGEGVLCFGPGFEDPRRPGASLLPTALFQRATLPAYLLYLGAFTRTGDAPFTVPVEVGT